MTVDLSIMITEIQDLFPHLSTQFLQRAFAHPAYSSGSSSTSGYNKEKLLIDLLEDSLPVDLKRDQDRQNANVREVEIQDREKIVSKPQSQLLANRSIYQDRVGAKDVLLSAGSVLIVVRLRCSAYTDETLRRPDSHPRHYWTLRSKLRSSRAPKCNQTRMMMIIAKRRVKLSWKISMI